MKILIIGGTGLISTAMTRFFAERGDELTLYNRGKSSVDLPEVVRQIVGDRNNYGVFEEDIRRAGDFDCVLDMICYQPEDARSLSRVMEGRTAHLIVCSTVDVYSKPAHSYPITESEPYGPPPWDYAQNKAILENILWETNARGNLPVTIIRPAYTYGEGRGMITSMGSGNRLLDRLKKGKPIVVHGDGSSLWVSCHRDDVARSFVEAAAKPITFGKSYHVTGDEWVTWNRHHEIIAEAIGAPPPKLVHIPTDLLAKVAKRAWICSVNFQYHNIFDNSAARRDLGFNYSIPLYEGVQRIYQWLVERDAIEDSVADDYDERVIAAWERLTEGMGRELASLDG